MPFLIATGGYKLPTAAGVPWIITQGPYGTFSHWGNSLHAFDIAPREGSCVVAMKAGIAYTHDLGLRQDHRHHSFGNYITIDHGNGEFSHYAHLATGTFVVKNGEHVEQGQALATAGNSGYTLGEGGGYHVHVSVTRALPISSSSVPFQFEDLPDYSRGSGYRTVVSSNASPLCDCRSRQVGCGRREFSRRAVFRLGFRGSMVEPGDCGIGQIEGSGSYAFLDRRAGRSGLAFDEPQRPALRGVCRYHRLFGRDQSENFSRAESGSGPVADLGGRHAGSRANQFWRGDFGHIGIQRPAARIPLVFHQIFRPL